MLTVNALHADLQSISKNMFPPCGHFTVSVFKNFLKSS